MKRTVLIFSLVLAATAVAGAQVRTVTNSTLQKFQDRRVAAEREYRDNYERLGFPSPEELDRQREDDMAARIQLAEQLRQARLEKERIELERRGLDLQAAALANQAEDRSNGFYSGYVGGFGGFYSGGYFGGRNGRFNRSDRLGGGYRATPVGVYPEPSRRLVPFFSNRRTRGGSVIIRGTKR